MSRSQVTAILGGNFTVLRRSDGSLKGYDFGSITTFFNGSGRVNDILVHTNAAHTPAGLRVGSGKSDVDRKMGPALEDYGDDMAIFEGISFVYGSGYVREIHVVP
jgi:hypothetical protein